MAPDTEGAKERSNIEHDDVAELVSKLDTKHNVKVAAQDKGQKSNHSLINWSDKGAFSSVIQSTNLSGVPSFRPRTAVHPNDNNARLNPEHKKGTKC